MQQQAYLYRLDKARSSAESASFDYLDWQRIPAEDRAPILLLTGSAGGGKSLLAGHLIHRDMLRYRNAMSVILRKTRESMTNSTVLFYERQIVGKTPHVHHNKSAHRFEYEDTNSIVAYGGMKDEEQREQIRSIGLSGGLDRAWMEEANRFQQADLNEMLARMRGTATPYCQILLTTNPDAPTHWIKTLLIDGGKASVYFSSALDNAHNPPEYLNALQQMTGIQGLRLRDGKWVQAEGVVFDNWDLANVSAEAEYNPDWPLWWGVDDGYVQGQGPGTESYHPRVILFLQPTPIGGVNVVDEYYATGELSETSIANAFARPYKRPEIAYIDSSAAEFKSRLWNNDIPTMGATHTVSEGIKNLRRLICDEHGVRLFRINPLCKNLNRELASYRYDDGAHVASVGEPKPLKIDDHGPDAARYATFHLRFE